ncbi:MAG TPA: hypothetical protein VJ912_02555 [Candidatus Nanoarchaeia archaeon]|nr:hypothetical protein [Candidatus Nanoarchaeia archaeon]
MADKKEEKSEEEKKKEANRDFALEMMKDESMRNLAGAYLLEKRDFGKDIKNAAKNTLVGKSLQDGMKYVDMNQLLQEGEDGESYMNNSVKVKEMVEGAYTVFENNLVYMKVNDVLKDMGANEDKKYGEKYVKDLLNDKSTKEYGQHLLGLYTENFTYKTSSEASKKYSDNIINTINENGLEKMVKGNKEKQKQE